MADRGLSRGHAIVVGGGHAGLLAARVLSDHFDAVTIVERDRIGPGTTFRAGVPQGYHPHFLMAKGAQILDGMFPGLLTEMADAGAPFFDHGEGICPSSDPRSGRPGCRGAMPPGPRPT